MKLDFKDFAKAVKDQFDHMALADTLYVVDSDRQEIYDRYLNSFPEGTNPIFKERTEHDCNTCKNFIRDIGNVVAIVDGKYQTIWDLEPLMALYPNEMSNGYREVAESMAEYIRSLPIKSVFVHYQSKVGNQSNAVMVGDKAMTFNHFHATIPNKFVSANDRDTMRGNADSTHGVFVRGLETITDSALETVLELIDQNSIYRGAEHKNAVAGFKKLKDQYNKLNSDFDRMTFGWSNHKNPFAKIRNTAVGTLLVNISEGMELDEAVNQFEKIMAPSSYKRTTAVITQGMINQAVTKIRDLGIENALQRRFAHLSDISVNNVLFASRQASTAMKDPLAEMLKSEAKPSTPKSFDKVEEVSVDDFISKILPKATSVEVMVENRMQGNFVSLIAPSDSSAKNILKWDNNFSWSYNGNVTDSIKERVKAAGGNTDAWLRISLSWFNLDDLDLHIIEPNGDHIYYGTRGTHHRSSGMLDVDMNAGGGHSREAVENITYADPTKMPKGKYKVIVNNYNKRESIDVGFQIQTELHGQVNTIEYPKAVANKQDVHILEFTWDGNEIKFSNTGSVETRSIDIWGIKTNQFVPVHAISLSPNYWDGQENGNKHYFFFIEGCKTDESTRGLYNEFLSNELTPHRKVFEVLGDKMKCPKSDEQLSGVGFSSTKRDEITVKVTGEFTRVIKVKF